MHVAEVLLLEWPDVPVMGTTDGALQHTDNGTSDSAASAVACQLYKQGADAARCMAGIVLACICRMHAAKAGV